jgi:hypothetical protein
MKNIAMLLMLVAMAVTTPAWAGETQKDPVAESAEMIQKLKNMHSVPDGLKIKRFSFKIEFNDTSFSFDYDMSFAPYRCRIRKETPYYDTTFVDNQCSGSPSYFNERIIRDDGDYLTNRRSFTWDSDESTIPEFQAIMQKRYYQALYEFFTVLNQ